MPGFVDTHLHAPQYPNCGKGLDKSLLDWLKAYTFPTEAKFKDLSFAADAYKKAVVSTFMLYRYCYKYILIKKTLTLTKKGINLTIVCYMKTH